MAIPPSFPQRWVDVLERRATRQQLADEFHVDRKTIYVWGRTVEAELGSELEERRLRPPIPIPQTLTEDEIVEAGRYGNAAYWLELHENCLRAIPANHPERPRLEEQRRLLRQRD